MALTRLTGERLIVGEGMRDSAFLEALCSKRLIEGFQCENVDGNTTFGSLERIKILPGYDKLSMLLIFGDNDEHAGKSFGTIKEQLNDAGLASPTHPQQIARKKGSPPVAVVMMPFPDVEGNTEGCLETLLIPAIARAHPMQKACVDTMFACVGATGWATKSSRDKLLVRCVLSASCEDNPMCGHPQWYKASINLVPLGDPVFDGLADLLQNAPAWFASGIDKWQDWKAVQNPAA
jgi:hypothetical protein